MKILFMTLMLTSGFATRVAFANKACFAVQGMTCATCSLTLKSAVKKLKGITNVDASLERKNATVEFDPEETSAAAIKKAIDDVGYKATVEDCKKI
ncbi:MAG: heavy-metal-associated domain-containing protein [Bdellovibrionales bacterium]